MSRKLHLTLRLCLSALVVSTALITSSLRTMAESGVDVVPADAAFFMSQQKIGRQWSALMASNFVKKIQQLQEQFGAKDLLEGQVAGAIGDPTAPDEFKKFWEDPENKQLAELLWDMIDDEVFIYGGPEYIELGELTKEMDKAQREFMLEAAANGDINSDTPPDLEKMLPLENLEKVHVPATVIGFKISDPERANAQIARAQKLLEDAFADIPELAGRLGNIKIGEYQLLTMTLDGEQIPWEDFEQGLEAGEDEAQKEYGRKMIEIVKKKTVTITVGVIGEFLVVSLGDSNDHLRKFGTDPLVDSEVFAPLKKMSDKPLTAINYVSHDFANCGRTPEYFLSSMKDYGRFFIAVGEAENGPLDPELKKQIETDIDEFTTDMAKYMPNPSTVLHFNYLTEDGYESYTYNHMEQTVLDGSKELTILEHLGGDPIAFSVGRSTFDMEDYNLAKKWLGKVNYYTDFAAKYEADQSGDQEQYERYQRVKKEFAPFAAKLDKIITNELIPALKDNQSGFVLDNKLHSHQWFSEGPRSDEPLPMLQPAYVWGVSDVTLLRSSIINLYNLGDEVLATAKKIAEKIREEDPDSSPEEIPFDKVPRPTRENVRGGAVFFYAIPAPIESNESLAATLGLSTDAAALAITKEHATRLMNRQTLTVSCLATEHEGPAAAATYIDFARIIDTAKPWVNYAIKHADEFEPIVPDFGPGGFDDLGPPAEFDEPPPAEFPGDDLPGEDFEKDLFDENSKLDRSRSTFVAQVDDPFGQPAEDVEEPDAGGFPGPEFPDPVPPVPGEDGDDFDFGPPELTPEERQAQIDANLKISETVFQLLEVIGSYSSVTYMEGDVTVTKTRWRFNDLPAAALAQ